MELNSRRSPRVGTALPLSPLSVLMVILLGVACLPLQSIAAQTSGPTIPLLSSGLVHQDSLSSYAPDTSYWSFVGDGMWPWNENSIGLHIGEMSQVAGTWDGFYAESPNTNAQLFHAYLVLQYSSLSSGFFNTGMYVQTYYGGLKNYVACLAQTTPTGYTRELIDATGTSVQATNMVALWAQSNPSSDSSDLVKDCTIVTNGSNLLELFMNGSQVYYSASAGLFMPAPFEAFLEVETSYSGGLLYGTYSDYYAASSDAVTVHRHSHRR